MAEGDELARIAAALERLAPAPVPPTDWLAHPAYVWEGERARAVPVIDALPLEALHGIDAQKAALLGHLLDGLADDEGPVSALEAPHGTIVDLELSLGWLNVKVVEVDASSLQHLSNSNSKVYISDL